MKRKKTKVIVACIGLFFLVNGLMDIAGVWIYTPVHEEIYQIKEKQEVKIKTSNSAVFLSVFGKDYYQDKQTLKKSYDLVTTSSPFNGYLSIDDQKLESISKVKMKLTSNGEVLNETIINGRLFEKEYIDEGNDYKFLYEITELDVDPEKVKSFTLLVDIEGKKAGENVNFSLKREYEIEKESTTHTTRIMRPFTIN